jgi:DNA-binding MarR family transcriptional regulator
MATTLAANELATQLRHAVARTARRLRQEAGGLTPSLTAALASVERHGPLTPSELARVERVQRPTATKLIARLEEQGLVGRTRDPEDGRSCSIALTPEGRAMLRTLRTRKDVFLAERLRALPAEDRETLARAAALMEALWDEEQRS